MNEWEFPNETESGQGPVQPSYEQQTPPVYTQPPVYRQPPLTDGSYYAPRPSTPMGAPRHPRRRGWIVAVLVVALLALGAYGVVRTLQNWDFDLTRDAHGFALSIAPRQEEKPEAEAPESSADEPVDEPLPETEPPETFEPRPIPAEDPQLAVQPGLIGAENSSSDAPDALSLQAIYAKMIPSVVSISSSYNGGAGTGTGIIMSADGYIITNHHVIDGAIAISVLTSGDEMFAATLVGSDEASDLAVLKVEPEVPLVPAEFGDSDALRVGDAVVAIGDPLGIQLRGTMTDGIISAINRDLTVNDRDMTLIQTNAALNNGNSGGPLINCYGQVVGINTMKMSAYYSGATVEGLGFAIPISVAKPIIDELIENGYVAGRPALGISGEQLPNAVRAYYRLPDGVFLTYVNPNSDTFAKGIREGDIITAINDTPVSTVEELNAVKNDFVAGDTVTLTVFRSGNYYLVEVVLMDQALQ